MLVVFSLMPVTALAGTGAANADYRAIANDADISIPDNYTNYEVMLEIFQILELGPYDKTYLKQKNRGSE